VKAFFADSRYRLAHAIVSCIVTAGLFLDKDIWRAFVYGPPASNPPPSQLIRMVLMQSAFFGALLLLLWVTTLFRGRKTVEEKKETPPFTKIQSVLFACKWFVPVCLLAFATEFLSLGIFKEFFDIELPPQDLVRWLKPGAYPSYVQYTLMAMAVVEAPIVEELLFRGVIFKGLGTKLPLWPSILVSGFVFAMVHVSAATLLPLWILGAAFAWVYAKTGSILAPVSMHFLFNALNLVLCLAFPEMAQ
jgi:membrane protease YdiL (CAAX protease family)